NATSFKHKGELPPSFFILYPPNYHHLTKIETETVAPKIDIPFHEILDLQHVSMDNDKTLFTKAKAGPQEQEKSALQYRPLIVPFAPVVLNGGRFTVNPNSQNPNPQQYIPQHDDKGYIIFEKGLILGQRYELVQQLGKGTFSKVFMAKDLYQPGICRAIKVIRNLEKYQVIIFIHHISLLSALQYAQGKQNKKKLTVCTY
ncbi:dual specificity protein kinase CLK2, partial [Reticulomyxa filosa]